MDDGPEGPNLQAACQENNDALVLLGYDEQTGRVEGLRHLAVLDDIVYGCAEETGLVLWDVSNLSTPRVVRGDPAGLDANCQAIAVEPSTQRMLLARPDALELYSLEDPQAPSLLTSLPRTGVQDLEVAEDGRFFGAAGSDGVLTFGIDGDTIAELGQVSDGNSDARAVAVTNLSVWAAEGEAGARRYQRQGDTLTLADEIVTGGTAVDVAATGTRAYAATLEGVVAIDTTDLNSVRLAGIGVSPGTAMGVAATDEALWLADWRSLRAFDPMTLAITADEPLVGPLPSQLRRTSEILIDQGRFFAAHWDGLWTYAPCQPNAAALWPEAPNVDFGAVPMGEVKSRVLSLRNLGNQALSVQTLRTDKPEFSVPGDGFIIQPGSALPIEVAFTPTDLELRRGNLIVVSNDPDQPEMLVPMAGNTHGARVGEPVVPFHDVDINGKPWRPKDLEGQVYVLAYFATW